MKFFVVFCILYVFEIMGGDAALGTFDVMENGAKADGSTDDTKAFMAAWKAACGAAGSSTLLVPKGKYLVGPLKFHGPCKGNVVLQMEGELKATIELGPYGSQAGWFEFGWLSGFTLKGSGTFDGQGQKAWPNNKCPKNLKTCQVLPTSLKFVNCKHTKIIGVTSLNPKFFHLGIVDCDGFEISDMKIEAPGDSPNTDGIHLEGSTGISISHTKIATGDDCISIGQGNSFISIVDVTCGPGHGISVGSLGRYPNEKDVKGLIIKGCTLSGTTNGVRIKTWPNSPGSSVASNLTFEDVTMNDVQNPIIIDQQYCPYLPCPSGGPSKVKISDVFFKNIKGTSATETAIVLQCSKGNPCSNVNIEDVELKFTKGPSPKAECLNVDAKYSGTVIPPPCL